MNSSGDVVFGKIMLFGEYGLWSQGRALTIPLRNFSGTLRFTDAQPSPLQMALNNLLKDYFAFLVANRESTSLGAINANAFEKALNHGLYFASDIPQGYGAGSSGALVAAVYRRFGPGIAAGQPDDNLQELQNALSGLEAYFHGTSSGIDPLSCYLGVPLEFYPAQGARPVNISKQYLPEKAGFFLISAGFARKTGDLVRLFQEKCKQKAFRNMMQTSYNRTVSACIDSLLSNDFPGFQEALKHLSELQYNHFFEMIPEGFREIWKHGLTNQPYTLKLCGAGGGGFILGFASDVSLVQKIFTKNLLIEISL